MGMALMLKEVLLRLPLPWSAAFFCLEISLILRNKYLVIKKLFSKAQTPPTFLCGAPSP